MKLMKRLWPFFTYFGGKWRIAKHYPAPSFNSIIEPFCGSAGYSLMYPHKAVFLYDLNPKICGVWDYLIKSKEEEILSLPEIFEDVRDLAISQEAKWLIGFWLNKGVTYPCHKPSQWMRSGIRPNSMWGAAIKCRIALQQKFIRHWKVKCRSYHEIRNKKATWFIDPPYQRNETYYPFDDIDYGQLASFCKSRKGQVIVCERPGARWLPFKSLGSFKGLEGKRGKKKTEECVWIQENK